MAEDAPEVGEGGGFTKHRWPLVGKDCKSGGAVGTSRCHSTGSMRAIQRTQRMDHISIRISLNKE